MSERPAHWTCPDCGRRCRCHFPDGLHDRCGRVNKGPHLRIVVTEPTTPHQCRGYPVGSCPTMIPPDRTLCWFCEKTKRLERDARGT